MPEKKTLREEMHEVLPLLDAELATAGIKLYDRPHMAALQYVLEWVIEIGRPDGTRMKPSDLGIDFFELRESRVFFDLAYSWYRDRYGDSASKRPPKDMTGVVFIHFTPFRISVPRSVFLRPGKGNSWWVRWPDEVLEKEDPLSWLCDGPNIGVFSDDQRAELKRDVCAVAVPLRRVNTRIMGTPLEGRLGGILRITMDHLEGAARLILQGDKEGIQRSYWEMQMACECAFKAVLEQKSGGFKETHDLFYLYDLANRQQALPVDRNLLKRLPRKEDVIELRYALGDRDNLFEAFGCYRTTLEVVSGTLGVLSGLNVGKGELCLRPLPWKRRPTTEGSEQARARSPRS